MDILVPDFYSRFECTADKCSDTCCIGWRIFIDDNTYKRYVKKGKQLGKPAHEWLIKKDGKIMAKLDNGRCPMLNEKCLCDVVLKLGSGYLSNVCKQYPRESRAYGLVLERNMKISCPEVARFFIEPDYFITFDYEQKNTPNVKDYEYGEQYLFQSTVRFILIDLLTNFSDLSLETRMYAVFNILEKAISKFEQGQFDMEALLPEIKQLLDYPYLASLDKKLADAIKNENRYKIIREFKSMMKELAKRLNSRREPLLQAIEYLENISYEKYLEDMALYKEKLKKFNNFYTNYWIYRLFNEAINLTEYKKVKDNLLFAAGEGFFMSILLMADMSKTKSMDTERFLQLVAIANKNIDHSQIFRTYIIDMLNKNNLVSTAGLMLMLFI